MVHGYHLILPHYGFWLPNDPRGSWSEFVASWEIARFGETTRHRYKAEQIANLLKGAGTRQLIADDLHPLRQYAKPDKRPPGMWARHQWKSFLDSDAAIENAIAYVIENPIKEGKPRQNWKWITPYAGLEPGWTTYH